MEAQTGVLFNAEGNFNFIREVILSSSRKKREQALNMPFV
jgi:hypothetical protein